MRLLLAAVVLALAATLLLQWREWPPPDPQGLEAETEAGPIPVPAAEQPLALLDPPEDKEEYAVVLERPLFLPERRPPSDEAGDEEEQAPAADDGTLDLLDLNAVMITPGRSIAWVRDPVGKDLQDLEPGDELNGWTVKEILADRVVLERQGETDTLTLRDYQNMPPPVPPRPRAAERAPARPGAVPPTRPPPAEQGRDSPPAKEPLNPRPTDDAQRSRQPEQD